MIENMTDKSVKAQRLLDYLSDLDDYIVQESLEANVATMQFERRKRVVKYSIAGVAGVAVSVGLAMMVKKMGGRKLASAS